MPHNIFRIDANTELDWKNVMNISEGRVNLGGEMPVIVYRLFQYSMREKMIELLGKDKMVELFRKSGEKAGTEFARNILNLDLDLDSFLAQLQQKLLELKIGVLRIEVFDADTGHVVLTVGEDLDCSGLPITGETVCNYDEGFIAGILQTYTNKPYVVFETDCWATGDRICRFEAHVDNTREI